MVAGANSAPDSGKVKKQAYHCLTGSSKERTVLQSSNPKMDQGGRPVRPKVPPLWSVAGRGAIQAGLRGGGGADGALYAAARGPFPGAAGFRHTALLACRPGLRLGGAPTPWIAQSRVAQ